MSAEIFKMIAYVGMIVFLNCIIAGIFDLILLAFFSDSRDVDDVKEEVAEKCLILIIVIAVIALITALDGALLYSALSNK